MLTMLLDTVCGTHLCPFPFLLFAQENSVSSRESIPTFARKCNPPHTIDGSDIMLENVEVAYAYST